MDSITFYILEDNPDRAEVVLHDRTVADGVPSLVTIEGDIVVVRVTGGEFLNCLGVILDIAEPLSGVGVDVHDVITPVTSVTILVAWDGHEETLSIIQDES